MWIVFLFFSCTSASNIEVLRVTEQIRNVRENSNNDYTEVENEANYWTNWLAKGSKDFLGNIKSSLSDPEWWKHWVHLPEGAREEAISRFLPMLNENKRLELHCSDAVRLCLLDRNCRSVFWHFLTSCSNEKINLEELEADFDKESHYLPLRIRRNAMFSKSFEKRTYRGRRLRNRRRKRKYKSDYPKYLRRVFRTKSAKKTWNKATEKMHYWMGKYWPNIFSKSLAKRKCSSTCLNALLMLNQTVYSTLLATCDCSKQNFYHSNKTETESLRWDEAKCNKMHAKALVCRPRLFKQRRGVIGCTESRLRCQHDSRCSLAQKNFLLKCSRVISGKACSRDCQEAIKELSLASRHFNTCVCDGTEKRICSQIRENIQTNCQKKNCLTKDRRSSQNGLLLTNKNINVRCAVNKRRKRTKKSISFLENASNSSQNKLSPSFLVLLFTNAFIISNFLFEVSLISL